MSNNNTENPETPLDSECNYCHRTRTNGCLCTLRVISPEEEAREKVRTQRAKEAFAASRQQIKQAEVNLQMELEHFDSPATDDDPPLVEITCITCGVKDKASSVSAKAQVAAKLCGRCYCEQYRRRNKEPLVKCRGGCGERFAESLLSADKICAACSNTESLVPTDSRVIYQAESGLTGELWSLMGHAASSVAPVPIRWIWEQRFPAGKIALLNGPQGGGKSMLFIEIVAHVTTGRDWPDGMKNTLGPRKVLLASTEDDEADTIIPRMMAAGADLNNVIILDKIKIEEITKNKGGNVMGRGKSKKTLLSLKAHTKILKSLLKAHPDIALILLDPITAFLGVDETSDKHTRPVLESVAEAIQGTLTTLIGIIHSNKMTKGSAGDKVKGGSSVLGVTRTAWAVGRDPEDKSQRYMALIKGNVLKKETGLRFTIENKIVNEAQGIEAGYVVWGEELDEDANDMLAATREGNRESGKDTTMVARMKLMVNAELEKGPQLATAMYRMGEREFGENTGKTLKRAQVELGGLTTKTKPYYWYLPGFEPMRESKTEDPTMSNMDVM